ncbi:SRPBCC domain-containing protein [Actinopolymorpha singaporensis]
MELDPIVHEYVLRCGPERAFEVYTGDLAAWWHPSYTMNAETLTGVTMEPQVGGRVFESHRDGEEYDWGRVTVWEPGHRLAYTSTLAQPSGHPSEITVDFTPHDGGCRMRFQHGGWNADNAAERSKFTEWPNILDRFAALADGAPAT